MKPPVGTVPGDDVKLLDDGECEKGGDVASRISVCPLPDAEGGASQARTTVS